MSIDLNSKWKDQTIIAFDTETSGAYPLGAEIVEFAAVKWQNGQIIDEYQTLLKPSMPMSDFIIGIHGISNEMVSEAPLMKDKIIEIRDFLENSVLMAHHAPFDMGFLTVDFEKYKVNFPNSIVLCTSLLSRNLIPESPNHKLQTLIPLLGIKKGTAHRALDDSKACLEVGLECLNRIGGGATVGDAVKKMKKKLNWHEYSLLNNSSSDYQKVVQAISNHQDIEFIYLGGSLKDKPRKMTPVGIVRNPDGDFIMGECHIDRAQKRFYLNKMKEIEICF